MDYLIIEIYEKEMNQLISSCYAIEIFPFPLLMNYAWLVAISKKHLLSDADKEDYRFVIREN